LPALLRKFPLITASMTFNRSISRIVIVIRSVAAIAASGAGIDCRPAYAAAKADI
jgi:hypothetical protein